MEIKLTQGKVALVDERDYAYLSQWKWYAKKDYRREEWYAYRSFTISKGKYSAISMHRELLNIDKGKQVDHIDHNGLNNCRDNLRIVTASENQKNQRRQSNNTSGFTGVYLIKKKELMEGKH